MRVYTVHTPPDLAGEEADEAAAFIKDGFCWPTLFIPVLWLLWHRHWLVLVFYLVAGGLIAALAVPLGETASALIGLVFAFWFAFEANNLRRWALHRRDWAEVGASRGRNRAEAEIRFFVARANRDRSPRPQHAAPWQTAVPTSRPETDREPVLGLFPETDR